MEFPSPLRSLSDRIALFGNEISKIFTLASQRKPLKRGDLAARIRTNDDFPFLSFPFLQSREGGWNALAL